MLRFVVLLCVALSSIAAVQADGQHGQRHQPQHRPLQFNPKEARHREHVMGHMDDFVRPAGVPAHREHHGGGGHGGHDEHGGHGGNQGGGHGGQEGQAGQQATPNAAAGQAGSFTDEELEFHYFRTYDHDHNNMLDGLEILKGVLEENSHNKVEGEEGSTAPTVLSDQQLATLVDAVMADQDHNRDGYIDYTEFAAAQRAARKAVNNL